MGLIPYLDYHPARYTDPLVSYPHSRKLRFIMNWRHVQSVVDELGYDFQRFEVDSFIHYLEQQRHRGIVCVPYDFSPGLTGLWIPAETADYLFYTRCTHPVHQVHIVLHEIAHLLLNHDGMQLDRVLPPELLERFRLPDTVGSRRFSESGDDFQEQEAEAFVYLIQQRITAAHRLDELTRDTTSIAGLDRFADPLRWLK